MSKVTPKQAEFDRTRSVMQFALCLKHLSACPRWTTTTPRGTTTTCTRSPCGNDLPSHAKFYCNLQIRITTRENLFCNHRTVVVVVVQEQQKPTYLSSWFAHLLIFFRRDYTRFIDSHRRLLTHDKTPRRDLLDRDRDKGHSELGAARLRL